MHRCPSEVHPDLVTAQAIRTSLPISPHSRAAGGNGPLLEHRKRRLRNGCVCVLEVILAKVSSSSRDTAVLLGTPTSVPMLKPWGSPSKKREERRGRGSE